jgi:transcriptional regulator with XRE-family HTH domain
MASSPTVSAGYTKRIQRIIERVGGQVNLAKAAGVSQPTVSGWLRGAVPYQSVLDRMCANIGINPHWVLFKEQPEEMGIDEQVVQSTPAHGAIVDGTSASVLDTPTLCNDLGAMISSWPLAVGAHQGIVWERISGYFEELNRRVNQEIDSRRAARSATPKIYPYPKGASK